MSDNEDLIFTFDLGENDSINTDFDLEQSNVDANFNIYGLSTTWGNISGTLSNQTDLQDALDAKQDVLTAGTGISIENNVISNTQTSAEWGNITGTLSNQTDLQNELNTLSGGISDINQTIGTYGDIVTYDAADFATSAQGTLASTALQPNDNITELVNNAGYITGINSSDVINALGYIPYNASNPNGYQANVIEAVKVNGSALTITDKAVDVTVPTNTSQLTNNSGFITNAVNDLTNYYLKSETYTKLEVQQLIASIPQFSIEVVQSLPVTGEPMVLYLVPKTGDIPDVYNEYIWIEDDEDYELIGNTAVDLTDYVKFTDLATVATTGDYDDLSNKPTIPTVGNGTITFTQGGVNKGSITTNQSGNTTIALDAGGGTVDQTFDGTSANAQSGVAIAGANFIQNKSIATDAISILGQATTNQRGINIGTYSSSGSGGAVAIGWAATASSGGVSVGYNNKVQGAYSMGIGYVASVDQSATNAIQLGNGTNSTSNSFYVGFRNIDNYQLLDGTTGLIPDARISTNIARVSNVPTITLRDWSS